MDVTRSGTGDAINGACSAAWLFDQKKMANALAPLLLVAILAVSGWQAKTEGQTRQTEQAVGALRMAISLIPAGILGLAVPGLLAAYVPSLRRVRGAATA